jgi:RNA polymerase sigma-32 factor
MSTALPLCTSKLPVVVDGLDAYIQKVNSVPLLTAEEEKSLALRYRQEGDLIAAQQLVLAHLRYVVRIARSYSGYGLALNDLIQEGTIGLMKAVKRFDPELGVRLVSFAVHWVKSEIHDFVIRNWRIVKVATTKAQRKLFFNLRGAKKRLGWFSTAEVQALAKDLGVTTQDVLEMESRLNAHDDSFDPLLIEDEELSEHAPVNTLAGPVEYNPEASVINNNFEMDAQDKLTQALQALDPRSLDIVSNRWLSDSKASLKELAEKYNVSIERVRQLEKAAMEKLRENVTNLGWVA